MCVRSFVKRDGGSFTPRMKSLLLSPSLRNEHLRDRREQTHERMKKVTKERKRKKKRELEKHQREIMEESERLEPNRPDFYVKD